ncbi:unnamed protein product [Caenorhabditis nigoni]
MTDLSTMEQRLEDVTAQASYWKGKLRIIEKQMRKLEKETKEEISQVQNETKQKEMVWNEESDSLRRQIEQLTHQLIQANADKKELQKRLDFNQQTFHHMNIVLRHNLKASQEAMDQAAMDQTARIQELEEELREVDEAVRILVEQREMARQERNIAQLDNERLEIERGRLEIGQIQLQATVVELIAANARLLQERRVKDQRILELEVIIQQYQAREEQGNAPGGPGNQN